MRDSDKDNEAAREAAQDIAEWGYYGHGRRPTAREVGRVARIIEDAMVANAIERQVRRNDCVFWSWIAATAAVVAGMSYLAFAR